MPSFDITAIVQTTGYLGLFLIVFAESGLLFGFFLPGDSLLFTAGFLASQGTLSIEYLIPLLLVAAVTGDAVGYYFGQRVGRRLFERGESLLFRRNHLLQAEAFFEKHGGKAVVLARFVPLVRTFTPIVAGTGAMRYRRFAFFNLTGALLWVVSLTLVGYFAGSLFPEVEQYLTLFILSIVALSVAPTLAHFVLKNRGKLLGGLRASRRRALLLQYGTALAALLALVVGTFLIFD